MKVVINVKAKKEGIVIDTEYNDDWMKLMRENTEDLSAEIRSSAEKRLQVND